MKQLIIGFTGLIASGKGTATDYLVKKHNAKQFKFSTILRDMASRIYLEHSRDNLIKMSETLRQTFGEDILSSAIAGDAQKETADMIVVDGIRRMTDIEHLIKLPNFVLVEIFAEPRVRYERLIKRGENTDDTSKTYEQFLADHERSTEVSILDVIPYAKEHLDNNGELESLHKQIDLMIEKYRDVSFRDPGEESLL